MNFSDVLIYMKKELKYYFNNKIIYLLVFMYASMVAAITYYTTDFNDISYRNLYQFFSVQPLILGLIIPALTMSFFAEEYKYNTLEILLSQPTNYQYIIIGKFLAAWIVSIIMIFCTSGFWIIAGIFIDLAYFHVFINYLVMFLLSAALCAVGTMISAYFYSAISSFLVTVAVCTILTSSQISVWISALIPDNVFLSSLAQSFNFYNIFDHMISGQIHLTSIAYFIILITASLWIGILGVEYKRK